MPIFEYQCKSCNDSFEVLVRSNASIACPDCGSSAVEKKFSSFSSHVKQSADAMPMCRSNEPGCDLGKCGSGRCGVA